MRADVERRWPWSALALVWALSGGLYFTSTTLIYHSFMVTGFDNAIIEQVVARLSHFSAPITEVEGHGVNYFGDHFSPVLAVYAPFYRLVPAPETLFAVQSGVLAASVVLLMVASTRHLGRRSGALLTTMYALSFGLLNSTVMSARETPFAVLLLAVAGSCYLAKSTRGVVVASLGLLLVKEDLGLTAAAIGFVLALEERSRRAGYALMAAGVGFFLAVMTVVIPAFRAGRESYYLSTSASLLSASYDGLQLKLVTLALTFGVAGLLCLRSRWSLVTLPTFAWRFTSEKQEYWSPLWHYSAVLMPVVFVAAVLVLRDASIRERRSSLALGAAMTCMTVLWALSRAVPVIDEYGSDRPESAQEALGAVPVGARVVADEYLVGHLARDRTAYYTVYFEGCPRPEMVLAHVGQPEPNVWGGQPDRPDFADLDELLDFADEAYGGRHTVVVTSGSYAVLRRVAQGPDAPCVPADDGSKLASAPGGRS